MGERPAQKGKPAGSRAKDKQRAKTLEAQKRRNKMSNNTARTPDARDFLGGFLKKEDIDGATVVTLIDVRPEPMPETRFNISRDRPCSPSRSRFRRRTPRRTDEYDWIEWATFLRRALLACG